MGRECWGLPAALVPVWSTFPGGYSLGDPARGWSWLIVPRPPPRMGFWGEGYVEGAGLGWAGRGRPLSP